VRDQRSLDLADAIALLEAAVGEADRLGVPETVCIVDAAGCPLALYRMDGARATGPRIAQAKAWTAVAHKRATHLFNEPPGGPALPGNEAFGIQHMFPGDFAIFVGGFPIVCDDEIVGGIGVSGGKGEQDKAVGAAAIAEFERRYPAAEERRSHGASGWSPGVRRSG
jgi:uncharacterized protein GlcG (DUF336 family)